MPTYSRDPRWIVTRRPGACSACGATFPAQTRAFYFPVGDDVMTGACAERAAAEFRSQAADEDGLAAVG